jgi:hypothetical protein
MLLGRSCVRTRRQLWDYVRRDLPEADLERVERHLQHCRACAADAEDYAVTAGHLQAYRARPVPPSGSPWLAVRERVLAAPRSLSSPAGRRPRIIWAAGAALVCATAAVGWWRIDRARTPIARTAAVPRPAGKAAGEPVASRNESRVGEPAPPGASPTPGDAPAAPSRAILQQRRNLQPARSRRTPPAVVPRALPAPGDDLAQINSGGDLANWVPLRKDELAALKVRLDRALRRGDDFVEVPFPRLAAADARLLGAAVADYQREKQVVDPRLARSISLSVKGISLADVCRELTDRTGVRFSASRQVADEKVTIFCQDEPVRDLMRSVVRLFGFVWNRSGDEPDYRYELTQTLASQLTEEELRNRDLNAALLALDEAMRKPVPEPPPAPRGPNPRGQTAQARAAAEELWSRVNWVGAIQLYQRLSPAELNALRNGQVLEFDTEADRAERRVPDDLRQPLLRAFTGHPFVPGPDGRLVDAGVPLVDYPGAGVSLGFSIEQREPGQLSLRIEPNFSIPANGRAGALARLPLGGRGSFALAEARSPSVAKPDNAALNRSLRDDPAFRREVSLEPRPGCPVLKRAGASKEAPDRPITLEDMMALVARPPMPHLDSADVWEEVHRQSGLPVVADYYTRLYPVEPFTMKRVRLFDVLCRAGDALGARWKKDGDFLLCRSAGFYWDRLQETPNRLLERWRRDRETRGELPVEDLLEMALLSDWQLNNEAAAQAIRHCWGIEEWGLLARFPNSARGLGAGFGWLMRAVAGMPPGLRERAFSQEGLALAQLPPGHQEEVVRALQQWNYQPLRLADSRIRLVFVPAGRYVWYAPHDRFTTEQYFALPVASGKSPEEALAAARKVDPKADAREIHRTRGVLTLFITYDSYLHSQGMPH